LYLCAAERLGENRASRLEKDSCVEGVRGGGVVSEAVDEDRDMDDGVGVVSDDRHSMSVGRAVGPCVDV